MSAQEKRRNEILDAGLQVLVQEGWSATSMIKIARRANASKETLYNWFGDKDGFFAAVIRRNAAPLDATLDPESRNSVADDLTRYGIALLTLLTGDKSVAINRAAMAEAGTNATLGPILVEEGAGKSGRIFGAYLTARIRRGELKIDNLGAAVELFIALLKGNMQLYRLLGHGPRPTEDEIAARARVAANTFVTLYGVKP